MPIGGHVVLCGMLGIGGPARDGPAPAHPRRPRLSAEVTEEVATVWFVGATGRSWSAGSA